MLETDIMRCCFCGLVPDIDEYVELSLRIESSPSVQWFGAHRSCLAERLASGFNVEIEPL